MRILVTFAVEWEFKPWMRLRSFQPALGSDCVFRTQIDGSEVKVVLTGIGQDNAIQSIRVQSDDAADLCVAAGLAGGLKREHRSGEVLVARAVCSETSSGEFESAAGLFEAAVDCGAKAVNRFVSARRVLRTARQKSELQPAGDAVDMESFAIMREMSRLGVPCVAVRSVADSALMNVPCDFDRALDASGRVKLLQAAGQVLCNPRQLMPAVRFGTQSFRAASSLARYLDGFIAYVARHEEKLELCVQQVSK